MSENKWFLLILLVGVVILAVFTTSTTSNSNGASELAKYQNRDGLNYVFTEIEGMPCLIVRNNSTSGYVINSVTCDWSKRK